MRFRILGGLPGTGPVPKAFGGPGYREGVVVEFLPTVGEPWVGNFQGGLNDSDVLGHPDGNAVVVIAGGTAYVVDPDTRELRQTFGHSIQIALADDMRQQLVFGDCIAFEALGAEGLRWRSDRVAWDDLRAIKIVGAHLVGEASHYDGTWRPFSLDLETGALTGGSYDGP